MFRLLNLGVTTSIDDFGIGYSSILYLRQLPLRELKVDCVFVSPMARSRQDHDIVEALISLAHGLGLRVVAEGVEDEATYALLKSMGCDRAQGYWIARAMPVDELATWVTNWNQRQPAS
jgi:EAL domain-containing protein (putative c-di-GMP-specific phosphodiesterase class I)